MSSKIPRAGGSFIEDLLFQVEQALGSPWSEEEIAKTLDELAQNDLGRDSHELHQFVELAVSRVWLELTGEKLSKPDALARGMNWIERQFPETEGSGLSTLLLELPENPCEVQQAILQAVRSGALQDLQQAFTQTTLMRVFAGMEWEEKRRFAETFLQKNEEFLPRAVLNRKAWEWADDLDKLLLAYVQGRSHASPERIGAKNLPW